MLVCVIHEGEAACVGRFCVCVCVSGCVQSTLPPQAHMDIWSQKKGFFVWYLVDIIVMFGDISVYFHPIIRKF